jgi:hypothetical protein
VVARPPDPDPAIPPALGAAVARRLAVRLANDGVRVVDPEVVLHMPVADAREDQPTRAIRIARELGASRVVFGTVTRYRERGDTGGAGGEPPAVAYQAVLVRALDGVVLATDRFDSASSGAGALPRILRSGHAGRDQILDGALGETASRFAAAVNKSR